MVRTGCAENHFILVRTVLRQGHKKRSHYIDQQLSTIWGLQILFGKHQAIWTSRHSSNQATLVARFVKGWFLVNVVDLGAIGAAISTSLGHGFFNVLLGRVIDLPGEVQQFFGPVC